MIVFPAIDIKNGKCVRLKQGLKDEVTVYGEDPVAMAKQLVQEGAQYLHVVDLDGAFDGAEAHRTVIETLVKTVKVPVEVGGGIRTLSAIAQYIKVGVARVIIGSKAVEDPDFITQAVATYGDKVAVSVDAKNGLVATKGWVETSSLNAVAFMEDMWQRGVKTFIYTDISLDGMLTGPNMEAMLTAQKALPKAQIIVSGGVSSVEDLKLVREHNLYGVITGRALYEGKITMTDIKALQ